MIIRIGSDQYEISMSSETGPRKENQDYAAVMSRSGGIVRIVRTDGSDQTIESEGDDFLLAVLCDGMGGMEDGAAASHMIVDAVLRWALDHRFDGSDWSSSLKGALSDAEDRLRDEHPGSGTTISLVIRDPSGWISAHIGDSRCYVVSDDIWRTADHSPVEEMYRSGMISEDEMNTSPFSNVISKYVGGGFSEQLELDEIAHDWKRLALCSDGVFGYMPPGSFKDALISCQGARSLVGYSLENGGKDNTTAIILDAVGRVQSPD